VGTEQVGAGVKKRNEGKGKVVTKALDYVLDGPT